MPEPPDADGESQASLEDKPPKRRRTDTAVAAGARRFLDLEAKADLDSAEDDDLEDGLEGTPIISPHTPEVAEEIDRLH